MSKNKYVKKLKKKKKENNNNPLPEATKENNSQ